MTARLRRVHQQTRASHSERGVTISRQIYYCRRALQARDESQSAAADVVGLLEGAVGRDTGQTAVLIWAWIVGRVSRAQK